MDNVNVLRVGFFAPDFSLPDTSGEIFSLKENLRENLVAVCFFPAYPDEKIKGYLRDLNTGLPPTSSGVPIKVVGITPEKTGAAATLKRNLKLEFPVLSDQKLIISGKYYLVDSDSFHTSVHFSIFLIDEERVIRHRVSEHAGFSEYNPKRFREIISKIL